jgi:hypothetical protein
MTESIWLWFGFNTFVLAMLALDLGVFHRQARAVSLRQRKARRRMAGDDGHGSKTRN